MLWYHAYVTLHFDGIDPVIYQLLDNDDDGLCRDIHKEIMDALVHNTLSGCGLECRRIVVKKDMIPEYYLELVFEQIQENRRLFESAMSAIIEKMSNFLKQRPELIKWSTFRIDLDIREGSLPSDSH